MHTFEYWKNRFTQNDLRDFSRSEEGKLWLRLRSIERKELVSAFCQRLNLRIVTKISEELWQLLNEDNHAKEELTTFMHDCQTIENKIIDETFENIRSNLYKMEYFHWGGDYRNSLDKAIVTRFIKTQQIIPYEQLNQICENEILEMTRGYLINSWYNYWSSVLIENIFRRHPHVMPAYGRIKNVDFFHQRYTI